MKRKTINCVSCEVKCDVILLQSNYEDEEEIEVQFCPICSANIEDFNMELEDDEWC